MNKRLNNKIARLVLSAVLFIAAAFGWAVPAAASQSAPKVSSGGASSDGFITVTVPKDADLYRVEILSPQGSRTSYHLGNAAAEEDGSSYIIPLTGGNGSYRIDVLEKVGEPATYAYLSSARTNVELTDELAPFLHSSCVISFRDGDDVAETARRVSEGADSGLAKVKAVYDYITANISYDTELAADAPSDYVPSPGDTLRKKSGIAPDYAALMAAMLRALGIPARMETGYFGEMYHAWLSVCIDESGTVGEAFDINAGSFSLIDPTIGACNKPDRIRAYLKKQSRYTSVCIY